MAEALDPREAKTLSDILALVLDDQPGSAAVALETLRRRAAADRVTGGAVKNLFVRLAGAPIRPSPDPALREFAALREVVADQAATIRALHQTVHVARDELAQAIDAQNEAATSAALRRGFVIMLLAVASFAGLGIGAATGWLLHAPQAPPPPPIAATTPATAPPAPAAPPGAVTIVPPSRDPGDTAPGPAYPPEAKLRGEEGTVGLLVHIDAEGHVSAIGVTQSAGADLDVATQQAIREWRFRPEIRDGKAVPSQIVLRFTYVLRAPAPTAR